MKDNMENKRREDCMFPSNLSPSDGEKDDLVMTPSIMRAEVYALVRKAEQYTFMQKQDVTVAVEIGDPNYEAVLMDNFPDWNKEYFNDMWSCLKAVADGRTDCFLISNYRYSSLERRCERYGLAEVNTDRDELVRAFEQEGEQLSASAENQWETVSVSAGVAEYDAELDQSLNDTFHRADQLMYERKRQIKAARKKADNG